MPLEHLFASVEWMIFKGGGATYFNFKGTMLFTLKAGNFVQKPIQIVFAEGPFDILEGVSCRILLLISFIHSFTRSEFHICYILSIGQGMLNTFIQR
jgi:hypothetical protein